GEGRRGGGHPGARIEHHARAGADEDTRRRRGRSPSWRDARRMARQVTMDKAGREAENARRMAEVFYPLGNVLLLESEPLRREDGVGLGCGLGAKPVHE